MPNLPAICTNTECKAVFKSGFAVSGRDNTFIGNMSGPCPNCGSMGRVPDGKYSAISDGIEAFLSDKTDVETLKRLHRVLSESVRSNNFESTKSELNEIAPNWSNVWGLLPENNVVTAIAVYTFVLFLLQTAMIAYGTFNEEPRPKSIIEHHHHYPKIEHDSVKGKQDSPQQNHKFRLKPLTMAIRIALYKTSNS